MKVKELIERLQAYNPEAEVEAYHWNLDNEEYFFYVDGIQQYDDNIVTIHLEAK